MKTLNFRDFADKLNPLLVIGLKQVMSDFKGEVGDRVLIKPARNHAVRAELILYTPLGHSTRLAIDTFAVGYKATPDAGHNIQLFVDFDLGNRRTLAEAEVIAKDLALILALAEIVKKNFEDTLVDE